MPNSYLVQVVAYTATLFLVMWWSGWRSEKTIYNISDIRAEGELFFVSDPKLSTPFYSDVVAFDILRQNPKADGSSVTFRLPDHTVLRLQRSAVKNPERQQPSEIVPPRGVILIRVRNSFRRLHSALIQRSGHKAYRDSDQRYVESMPAARVSEIVTRTWGDEFVVTDPDGNKLVYYRTSRKRRYGG